MADLGFSHPELSRRYTLLVGEMWRRGFDIWIASSSRSEAQQREWYALYLRGLWLVDGKPAIVADPDRDAGATPFGWNAHGSLHMIQRDGYSHALDLGSAGCTHAQLHAIADLCGLRFPEPTEWWHTQAFDAYSGGVFYPVSIVQEEGDDMQLVQCNDGDVAVFLRSGNTRSWVRDGNAEAEAQAIGWVDATPPVQISRVLLLSLALLGPLPQYAADYTGPRTTE